MVAGRHLRIGGIGLSSLWLDGYVVGRTRADEKADRKRLAFDLLSSPYEFSRGKGVSEDLVGSTW